jgi:hypothetical protein
VLLGSNYFRLHGFLGVLDYLGGHGRRVFFLAAHVVGNGLLRVAGNYDYVNW